jgi:hypothetical protein
MSRIQVIAEMSDENLQGAIDKLLYRRADAQVVIGRQRKRGAVVALSDDLPAGPLDVVSKAELVAEQRRRKGGR